MDAKLLYGGYRGPLDGLGTGQAQVVLGTVVGTFKATATTIDNLADWQGGALQRLVVGPGAIVASGGLPTIVTSNAFADGSPCYFAKVGEGDARALHFEEP